MTRGLLLHLAEEILSQVVSTGAFRAHQNQVMSMTEILYKLVEEQRTKCEEAQRLLIMSSCALAGLARIEAQLIE